MAKLSLAQLKEIVASVVTTAKLSNASFSATRDNIVGLIDKIGKIHTIDSYFDRDKLAFMDGEYLSFGKTIEEWQADLILPQDYDADGAGALSPHPLTFRPVFYSYTLGRKKIPVSIPNNNIERAVANEGQFNEIVAIHTKRLQDSMAQYRYGVKREMIGKLIDLAEGEMDFSDATAIASVDGDTPVNTIVKYSTTNIGILVKKWSGSEAKTWANAIAYGYVVELDLVTELAKPVDATKGEAFLVQLKEDVEKASDVSEGYSLNGNCLGASEEGLVLFVKQGIMPSLEVKTQAGAFHLEKVAIPTEVVVVKDFGKGHNDEYAVLCDRRGLKLHNTYRATRENFNGDGDFVNLFAHTEDTGCISRNTFVKIYKAPNA